MNTAPLTTMLDSAYAPTAAQIEAAGKAYPHLTAWAGYLPSPGAYHVWSPADFAGVRAAGLDVLPIYVTAQGRALNGRTEGASDGHGALSACEQYGLTGLVCLDVEEPVWSAGNASAVAHAQGFVQVLAESSRESVGYGPTAYCDAVAAIHAAVWAGQYPYKPPADPDPASLGFRAPAGWQWKGSHDVGGVGVDTSAITFAFGATIHVLPTPTPSQPQPAQGDDMALTFPQKEGIVMGWRALGWGWPTQVAVDAYAKLIADDGSNQEAVLTKMSEDFAAGGQPILTSRVAALEAKLAAMGPKP